MAEAEPERGEDQRELADLAHRHARQEADAARVAEPAGDGDDDERLGEQHERREHERGDELAAEAAEVEVGAEVEEEEQQQEVAQRHQPPADRLAVGGRRERHAAEEGADLAREPERVGERGEADGPCDRAEDQQLGRAGGPVQQRPSARSA